MFVKGMLSEGIFDEEEEFSGAIVVCSDTMSSSGKNRERMRKTEKWRERILIE